MARRWLRYTLEILIAMLLTPFFGLAQSPTLEHITGLAGGFVVRAADGLPIPRARVDFLIPSTGWALSTLTEKDGKFGFTGLAPTVYQVTVTAPAYEKLQLTVKVEEKSGPLLLRLRRAEQEVTPVNDSTVSVQELQMAGKAESTFTKGTRLLQKADAKESVAYFQAVLAKDPGYYRAHHNLGLAYYQLGQIEQAEEEFQKSIELTNGGYAPSEFALAMILCTKQDFRQAERLVENGLTMEPDSGLGKYFLGLVQFALNRLADAEQSAQDALKRNANQADAHILLAMIHERTHNPYAVMADVSAYFAADPGGPLGGEASDLLRRAQREIQQGPRSDH